MIKAGELAKMIDHSILHPTMTDDELIRECRVAMKYSGQKVQVKCAGGVRTLEDLLKMKAAGATRSGATATAVMLEEAMKLYGEA